MKNNSASEAFLKLATYLDKVSLESGYIPESIPLLTGEEIFETYKSVSAIAVGAGNMAFLALIETARHQVFNEIVDANKATHTLPPAEVSASNVIRTLSLAYGIASHEGLNTDTYDSLAKNIATRAQEYLPKDHPLSL